MEFSSSQRRTHLFTQAAQPKEPIQLMQVRRWSSVARNNELTFSHRPPSLRNQFNSCKSNDGGQPLKLTSFFPHFTWTGSCQQFTWTGSSHQFTWTSLTLLTSSFPQFTRTSSTQQVHSDEFYPSVHMDELLPIIYIDGSSLQFTWTSPTQLFTLTSSFP